MTHVQRKHFISSFTPHNLSQLSQNFCVILILISSGKSNLFQVVSPHCKFASTAFASSLPNVKQVRPTFTSLSPKRSTRSLASSPQNVFISCRNFPDMFRPTCNLCTAIKTVRGQTHKGKTEANLQSGEVISYHKITSMVSYQSGCKATSFEGSPLEFQHQIQNRIPMRPEKQDVTKRRSNHNLSSYVESTIQHRKNTNTFRGFFISNLHDIHSDT